MKIHAKLNDFQFDFDSSIESILDVKSGDRVDCYIDFTEENYKILYRSEVELSCSIWTLSDGTNETKAFIPSHEFDVDVNNVMCFEFRILSQLQKQDEVYKHPSLLSPDSIYLLRDKSMRNA